MVKQFYRVCNEQTQQGLWYDINGNFTGLIHNKFNFCLNNKLKMDYDPEIVGWLSAADSLDMLYNWFTPTDIVQLQTKGWFINVYETEQFKFYDRFQHPIIKQDSIKHINQIIL